MQRLLMEKERIIFELRQMLDYQRREEFLHLESDDPRSVATSSLSSEYDGDVELCQICKAETLEESDIFTLTCGHSFHLTCLGRCVGTNYKCFPYDRHKLTLSVLELRYTAKTCYICHKPIPFAELSRIATAYKKQQKEKRNIEKLMSTAFDRGFAALEAFLKEENPSNNAS